LNFLWNVVRIECRPIKDTPSFDLGLDHFQGFDDQFALLLDTDNLFDLVIVLSKSNTLLLHESQVHQQVKTTIRLRHKLQIAS
jgi:hypothetical protein